MLDFNQHTLSVHNNANTAIQKLNDMSSSVDRMTLLIVDDDNKLQGVITNGDIRRGLSRGLHLQDNVLKYSSKKFYFLEEKNIDIRLIRACRGKKIFVLPIVDENMHLLRILDLTTVQSLLPLKAVLMAGGRGKRLRPLTDQTPKPLIHVGEKPIIEHNIDRLISYGISEFYLSVNYLKGQFFDFFQDGKNKNIHIQYIEENEPLGTIGSMSLIKDKIDTDILVMNSDLFTDIDFEAFFLSYKDNHFDMCIAGASYNVDIPYAVLDTNENKEVKGLQEKPTFTYHTNAGIYIINHKVKRLIPDNVYFDATDLIHACIENNLKIGYFSIDGYWMDIGSISELNRAKEMATRLNM